MAKFGPKPGFKMSAEHKREIGNALRGKKKSPEHVKKMSIAMMGRICTWKYPGITPENRKKMT